MTTPPTDPWAPGVRAVDVPIDEGLPKTSLFPPTPHTPDIAKHLYELFKPDFVHQYPDAWIEIAFGRPDEGPNKSQAFSAFHLKEAAEFAEKKNRLVTTSTSVLPCATASNAEGRTAKTC